MMAQFSNSLLVSQRYQQSPMGLGLSLGIQNGNNSSWMDNSLSSGGSSQPGYETLNNLATTANNQFQYDEQSNPLITPLPPRRPSSSTRRGSLAADLLSQRRSSINFKPFPYNQPTRMTPNQILAATSVISTSSLQGEYRFPSSTSSNNMSDDQDEFSAAAATNPLNPHRRSSAMESASIASRKSLGNVSGLGSPLLEPTTSFSSSAGSRRGSLNNVGSRRNSRVYRRKDSVSALTEEEIQDRLIRKEAEKQRRDSLKVGYDTIKELLPSEMIVAPGKRKNVPNQQLLEKAAEYIEDLQYDEEEKLREIQQLEAEIQAMKVSLMTR
ncbi:hypothetical protein BDR26DRAFT_854130 [Obelidium mucronatum]|nr:hypothetical protein BDR26DRAFT_854130 [Obelidium mucronatum]